MVCEWFAAICQNMTFLGATFGPIPLKVPRPVSQYVSKKKLFENLATGKTSKRNAIIFGILIVET